MPVALRGLPTTLAAGLIGRRPRLRRPYAGAGLQRWSTLATTLLRAAVLLLLALGTAVQAADLPTFTVVLEDGVISTRRIELPAGQRFRIEVINKGKTPAEFESLPLGIELVVAPGSKRTRALPGKSPGTYPFFDEFHMQTTQGVFVVR